MGDRNYYANQYSPFMDQNHGSYSQSQQQPYLQNSRSPQVGVFAVNTSMPVYSTGAPINQAQNSGMQSPQYRDSSRQYYSDRPPPSYEESHRDRLLARSNNKYSPAWNYVDNKGEDKQQTQKSSYSNLFDIPGKTENVKKSPDWSSDSYNASQSYQRDPQGRFNPHYRFSQQPPTTFSSDYGGRSDYRFSQNNQEAFDKQNQNRGRGRRRRFGRGGKLQNKGTQRDGESLRGRAQFGGTDTVMSGSEDNVNDGNMGFQEQLQGSDDEGNGDGDYEATEKVNVYKPDHSLVAKYELYPPSPEEMGEMFKDLVIHFFFKVPKNRKEQNPFVIICESFRRSAGYCNLEVEDGFDGKCKDRKFCTLRYCGMMMVRGVGENNCIKEARVLAGVDLINKLAMSCYTLECKPEYFNITAFEKMLEKGNVPGVYRFAPEEVNNFELARNYLKLEVPKEDSDVEYIFHLQSNRDAIKLKSWANRCNEPKFDGRMIKDEWVGICRHRTTQYWRDKILASGSMETEKFILKPPQGIGNLLLPNFDVKDAIVQLKPLPYIRVNKLNNIYGPPGIGPQISKARPPWEKRGGGKRVQKNRAKERKIMDQLKQGVPLTQAKGYNYLSQRKKKILKKKLGQ